MVTPQSSAGWILVPLNNLPFFSFYLHSIFSVFSNLTVNIGN